MYQLDCAVQRGSCRAEHCVTDDISTAVLRDVAVLQHVLQLAKNGRAGHPDCLCDLLRSECLTTQRPRPQGPSDVGEFRKRCYVVGAKDACNQLSFELLCGISQDQPFLLTRDILRSHRHERTPSVSMERRAMLSPPAYPDQVSFLNNGKACRCS